MIDWTKSMQQTFEYFIVDPATWHDVSRLDKVKSCTITRDSSLDTLGSATLDCDENLNDKYVRVYLKCVQNGETTKVSLGTHLYQSPTTGFDGKRLTISHDGYTPLIELKEKPMPMGYYIQSGAYILDTAYAILTDEDTIRAPVVQGSDMTQLTGNFISETNDTKLSFITDLLTNAKFSLGLDENDKVIFVPNRSLESMQPVWYFNDDNSSILYPELNISRDIFGIPNKIEVIYSQPDKSPIVKTEQNDDPASILSYQARGRWIVYRETDPDLADGASEGQVIEYTHNRLKELSTVEYKITYTHGYCPVRLGDCVQLNYEGANYSNTNVKVIRQVIRCEEGCPVEETAVLTQHLWGGEL